MKALHRILNGRLVLPRGVAQSNLLRANHLHKQISSNTAVCFIHFSTPKLARHNQIQRYAFVDLLRGRAKGYRAAIVLGFKPAPVSQPL